MEAASPATASRLGARKHWFLDGMALAAHVEDPENGKLPINRLLQHVRQHSDDLLFTSPLADLEITYALHANQAANEERVPEILTNCDLWHRTQPISVPILDRARQIITATGAWTNSAVYEAYFEDLITKSRGPTVLCVVGNRALAERLENWKPSVKVFNPLRDDDSLLDVMIQLE